jgi:TBC1 domain family member 2
MDFQVNFLSLSALAYVQEIMMFLQALPTKEWREKEIELLLSEAYLYQNCFSGASAHFKKS